MRERYYHVFNRGIAKQETFLDKNDYGRFMAMMYLANSENKSSHIHKVLREVGDNFNKVIYADRGEPLVKIIQFCLMSSHFHMVIKTDDILKIGKFLQKLNTGYSMYLNAKYERSGSVWQGKPKKKLVKDNNYLRTLLAYVACNPLEVMHPSAHSDERIARSLEDDLEAFPYMSHSTKSKYKLVIDRVVSRDNEFESIFDCSVGGLIKTFTKTHPGFRQNNSL